MNLVDNNKCNAEATVSKSWNFLFWGLGTICLPILFPLILLNFWRRLRVGKLHDNLVGKVVLITGASSGLGESLAHTFYKSGCKVILAARRLDELERVKINLLAQKVNQITYPPTILHLDLAEINLINNFAASVLGVHNHVDILINNGGISVRSDIVSSTIDVDLKVMLVNYFGAVALTKALLPSMIKRKTGHICFVSSIQGKFALPFRSSYCASKHAVQAFADSLRAEVANKDVKVTCVSPGYIHTQLSLNALTGNGSVYGKMDKNTAAGMSPEKAAKKILNAILQGEKDLVICDLQARIALYLRFLLPSVYFWIMEKRSRKLEKDAIEDEQKKT